MHFTVHFRQGYLRVNTQLEKSHFITMFATFQPWRTFRHTDCFQYPICAGIGWASLVRLPYLYASVNQSASFHAVQLFVRLACTAFMLSKLLVHHFVSLYTHSIAFYIYNNPNLLNCVLIQNRQTLSLVISKTSTQKTS